MHRAGGAYAFFVSRSLAPNSRPAFEAAASLPLPEPSRASFDFAARA
eukprot:COSAG01_NODE_5219_length_4404_cov_19.378397_1_plen_46_part_10